MSYLNQMAVETDRQTDRQRLACGEGSPAVCVHVEQVTSDCVLMCTWQCPVVAPGGEALQGGVVCIRGAGHKTHPPTAALPYLVRICVLIATPLGPSVGQVGGGDYLHVVVMGVVSWEGEGGEGRGGEERGG